MNFFSADKNILFINSVGEIVFNDIPIAFSELDDKLKSIKDKNIIIAADKNVTTGKLNKVSNVEVAYFTFPDFNSTSPFKSKNTGFSLILKFWLIA